MMERPSEPWHSLNSKGRAECYCSGDKRRPWNGDVVEKAKENKEIASTTPFI